MKRFAWAAGVAASPVGAKLGAPLDRAGRVIVQNDLSIPDHPEVFVAGDLAWIEQNGRGVSGVAWRLRAVASFRQAERRGPCAFSPSFHSIGHGLQGPMPRTMCDVLPEPSSPQETQR